MLPDLSLNHREWIQQVTYRTFRLQKLGDGFCLILVVIEVVLQSIFVEHTIVYVLAKEIVMLGEIWLPDNLSCGLMLDHPYRHENLFRLDCGLESRTLSTNKALNNLSEEAGILNP